MQSAVHRAPPGTVLNGLELHSTAPTRKGGEDAGPQAEKEDGRLPDDRSALWRQQWRHPGAYHWTSVRTYEDETDPDFIACTHLHVSPAP